MVGILFYLHGKRHEIYVPFHEAKRINKRLIAEGAAVFWSWRC